MKNQLDTGKEDPEEMLEGRAEIQALIDGFSGFLLHLDKDLVVKWANENARQYFLHAKGWVCCDVFGVDGNACINCFVRTSLKKGVIKKGIREGFSTITSETNNKEKAIFEVTSSPVKENGEVTGVLLIVNNITEQFQLEKHLRQTQKMEAIGTLAAGVAHDFNNVLTPIIGYSEIIRLKMKQDGIDDPLIEEYLAEILVASKRAKQLVEQILTFSRTTEQKQSLQYVQPIVKEVVKLMRTMLPSTIKVTQEIDDKCGRIFIDPAHLHQVLVNLCTNSGHAMGNSHGELKVSLEQHEKDDFGRDWIKITVADTGCGIEPELLERIFDPYFTTREKEQGTGMGLAVVHGIVHSQGGKLEVDSTVGQGTTVNIYFPVCEEQTPVEQVVNFSDLEQGEGRILLVDDEEQVVDVVAELLRNLGYDVTGVTSSRQALRMFIETPDEFVLLITDLTMPDMTGVELCGQVKKIRPDLPVILCTGYSERVTTELMDRMGINRYCVKPVSMRELSNAVSEALA